VRIRAAIAVVALLTTPGLGCARAVNYLDGEGPRYLYVPAGPGPGANAAGLLRAPAPHVGAPFRVASFNIAHAIEIDRAIEVLRGTPELRAADALLLQEMDAPGTERIASVLGLHSVYFPSGVHPKHRKDFGCAVLSPWPLEAPAKLVLPHGARVTGLRRAAVSATVVRGSERVRVYSVHLPAPFSISPGARREQLRALAADAARHDGAVVIAGDFNSSGAPEVLARAGFSWPTRDLGGTAHFRLMGVAKGLDYDHVLVRGLDAYAAGIVQENLGSSDHNPVWALLAARPR
jgi:endonuclease/exonuclease/phosphatase family metal-dependent hydrolase